jgi:hypothetical protein
MEVYVELKPYPEWVCYDCGINARLAVGKFTPIGTATYHIDKCDVCEEEKEVTEPRDFGYPKFKGHKL